MMEPVFGDMDLLIDDLMARRHRPAGMVTQWGAPEPPKRYRDRAEWQAHHPGQRFTEADRKFLEGEQDA